MEANKYHKINGLGCTDETCWCQKFLTEDTEDLEDIVNHPKHYQLEVDGAQIEVTKLIELVTTKEEYIGYLKGNILKYHIRSHAKNGVEDIKKANFYSRILDRLI